MTLNFTKKLISNILFTNLLNHFSKKKIKKLDLKHNHNNYFIQKKSKTNKTNLTPLLKNLNNFHNFTKNYLNLFHKNNN